MINQRIFIDDLRECKYNTPCTVIRTFDDLVAHVKQHGLPQFISFDHDLADFDEYGNERTGYDVAKFLVEYMIDNNIQVRFDYVVHSANPVGKHNIESYLENYFDFIGV